MRIVRVLLLVLAPVMAGACDERLRDVAGPTPDLQPTLSSIQRDIFNSQDGSSPNGGSDQNGVPSLPFPRGQQG